eukprot:Skav234372  [mRNA]  locus=scaffold2071:97872:99035:+ [translate_table: standard]
MREKGKEDWWLAEETKSCASAALFNSKNSKFSARLQDGPVAMLAIQRELRWSDVLRLLGVLLPLPCTVLLLEQTLESQHEGEGSSLPVPGAFFGACGIFCAATIGLLGGGPEATEPQETKSMPNRSSFRSAAFVDAVGPPLGTAGERG